MVRKVPKKKVETKAKDGDDKGKALPTKKKKEASGGASEEDDEEGEKKKAKKAKAKQPASVLKKPMKGGDSDDAMEVDSALEKPAPKPKPKAVTKAPNGDEDEPAKKKQMKAGD